MLMFLLHFSIFEKLDFEAILTFPTLVPHRSAYGRRTAREGRSSHLHGRG